MLSVSSLLPVAPFAATSFTAQPVSALDRVSIRITPIAVSAPLKDERVMDNNQQGASRQVFTQSLNQQAPANQNNNQTAGNGNSAAYVAQALAQSSENSSVTLGAFSPFAPALQYNKLVSYSLVKYKPSDAGLPTGRSTATSTSTAQTPSEVATEYQAYSNTQLRNLSQLATSSPPVLIAG